MLVYRPNDLIICSTNNGTGRIKEKLKYEDLNRCVNFPISELLTIIIEEFLARRYERYVETNVQFSSGFKKYQNEIPSYLWNRPRIVVEDILNKMKQVWPAMIESVQLMPTVPETTFLIRGDSRHGTEMKAYCVDFGTRENFLRCSCPWFWRSRSLCKHLFAVIDSGYREFEDLTPLYRNHPLDTIDTNYFQPENDDTPLARKFILFQRYIIIFTFINCKSWDYCQLLWL